MPATQCCFNKTAWRKSQGARCHRLSGRLARDAYCQAQNASKKANAADIAYAHIPDEKRKKHYKKSCVLWQF